MQNGWRVPTAWAGAVPIIANPLAASKAKNRLRMKISLRRQPFVCRFVKCNPNRARGFPSTHDLREVLLVSNSRLDITQSEGPFRERNAADQRGRWLTARRVGRAPNSRGSW